MALREITLREICHYSGFSLTSIFPYMDRIYDFLHIPGNTYQRKAHISTEGIISIILAEGIISMFVYNSLICIFHTA